MIADTISFLLLVAAFWTLIIAAQVISDQNMLTGDDDVQEDWRLIRHYSKKNWQAIKRRISNVRHR